VGGGSPGLSLSPAASRPTSHRGLLIFPIRAGAATLLIERTTPAELADHIAARGVKIIDGIGSTELLHIFISAADDDIRPGSTGRPVPGYRAAILDAHGEPVPDGQPGRLAAKGPTGCKYLADYQQRNYVSDGWNFTEQLGTTRPVKHPAQRALRADTAVGVHATAVWLELPSHRT
jgi:acyl-coenzyme A synthetase/AMP-(fatty) acid ligase